MSRYPTEREADIALRDGSTARVRPVRANDGPAIRAFLAALSPDSIVFRFFGMPNLEWVISWPVDVDYSDRFALVAETGDPPRIVAHAAYVRGVGARAEVAFLVADELQGQGISTTLLAHLAAVAERNGIGLAQPAGSGLHGPRPRRQPGRRVSSGARRPRVRRRHPRTRRPRGRGGAGGAGGRGGAGLRPRQSPGAGRDQLRLRRGGSRRRAPAAGAARDLSRGRHQNRRAELPGCAQHRPGASPQRDVRATPGAARLDRVHVPERRPRDRDHRSRGAARAGPVVVRIGGQQDRPVRQRHAALLGAGSQHRCRVAVPRVVRQPAEIRSDRAPVRAPQAAAGGEERSLYRRGPRELLSHRGSAVDLGCDDRCAVRAGQG